MSSALTVQFVLVQLGTSLAVSWTFEKVKFE
jgi:hypothetical protein